MDQDIKPVVRCCVGCLQDDTRVYTEEEVNDDVIKVYKCLVINEISQLASHLLLLCDACIETLQNIMRFHKQCLSSIRYLSSRPQFDYVYVENGAENFDDIEIKQEEIYVEMLPLPPKVQVENGPTKLTASTNSEAKTGPLILPLKTNQLNRKRDIEKFSKERKQEAAYCSICGEFFQRNLLNHITSVHMMQMEDGQFKCNLCEEIWKDSSVIWHFDKHRDYKEAKVCKVCDMSYKNRKEYRLHVTRHNDAKHRDARQYRCDYCEATFVTRSKLECHIMSKHKSAMLCNYCQRAFFDKESYEKHMKRERERINSRRYFCDYCGYGSKYRPALYFHMKKYHNPDEPNIICNECGKSYKTRTQFRSHYLTVHLEKKHECSDCGKKFAVAKDLRRHNRHLHNEQEMFQECKVCRKKLKTSSMPVHMSSVHQQLRKHKCDFCDMLF